MTAQTPPAPRCDHVGVMFVRGGPHGTCPRCKKELTAEEVTTALATQAERRSVVGTPTPVDGRIGPGFDYEAERARRAQERLNFAVAGQDVTDEQIADFRKFFLSQGLPEVAEAFEDWCKKLGWRVIRRGDVNGDVGQYEVRRPDGSIVLVGYWSFRDDERQTLKETTLALLPALMLHPAFGSGFRAREAADLSDLMDGIDDLKRRNKTPRRRFNPIHAALADGQSPARLWSDLSDDERAFVRAEWPELDDERLGSLAWVFVEAQERETLS